MKRPVALAECGIDKRDAGGGNKAALGLLLLELRQILQRGFAAARNAIHIPPSGHRHRPIAMLTHPAVMIERFGVLPELLMRATEPEMSGSEIGIHLEHSRELLQRGLISTVVVMVEADVRVDGERQRLALLREADLLEDLAPPGRRQQKYAVPLMRRRIRAIELQRTLEVGFGAF